MWIGGGAMYPYYFWARVGTMISERLEDVLCVVAHILCISEFKALYNSGIL